MTFAPVKFYHAWIILSGAGAIGLLVIAFSRRRRRRVHDQMDRALTCPSSASPAPGAVRLLGGSSSWWLGLIALGLLMLIIGGPVVVAVPVLVLLARLWPNRYGVLALAAAVASGLLAALSTHPAAPTSSAFGGPAQAFALVALAAALVPALPGTMPARGDDSPESAAPDGPARADEL